MDSSNCLICDLPLDFEHEEIAHVKAKGRRNLKKTSQRRGDGKFSFLDLEVDSADITIHRRCWRSYTHEGSVVAAEKRIKKSLNLAAKNDVLIKIEGENGGEPVVYDALLHVERTNFEKEAFDYPNLCLFCGEDASKKFSFQQLKKPEYERNKVKLVTKNSGKIMLLAAVWGEEVLERVKDKDLISFNARYHVPCYKEYLSAIPNTGVLKNDKNPISMKKYRHNLRNELLGMDSEKIEKEDEQNEEFDYETHCIICAKDASENFMLRMKNIPESKRILVSFIKRPETAITLLQLSYISNETIREEVRSRVQDQDLIALKARYHVHCFRQFRRVKTGKPRGRPSNVNKQFKIVIEDVQPTCWDEFYKDYIVNEDVEFNFQIQCLICGRDVSESTPEDTENSIRVIQRHDTGENLLHASFRFTDKWREQVRDRVKNKDLVSLGARYHKSCFPKFFIPPPKTKKQIVCVADGNVSEHFRGNHEEQDIFSDVLDDISLDNEHESYYDVPIIENDQLRKLRTVEKDENGDFDYQNNCFLCGEDASQNFIKKKTKLHQENMNVNVLKKQSTVKKMLDLVANCYDPWSVKIQERVTNVNSKCIDLRYHNNCLMLFRNNIKNNALQNKHSLRDCHIIFDDEINMKDSASNDLTDFNKDFHGEVDPRNTSHGEKGFPENDVDSDGTNENRENTQDDRNSTEDDIVDHQKTTHDEKDSHDSDGDCEETNENREETQDDRNSTEDEATSDNFDIDEEYYEKKLFKDYNNISGNKNRKKTKERKEVSWYSQVCNTCLSAGTKLYRLVRYAHIFKAIIGKNDAMKINVCGECLDDLRKIQVFKEKAIKAQNILHEIRQLKETKKTDGETALTKPTDKSNKIKNDNENSNEDEYSDWDNDIKENDEGTELANNSCPTTSGVKQKCDVMGKVTSTKRKTAIKLISEDESSDSDQEPATKKHKIREEDSDYVPSDYEFENKIKPPKKNKNKELKRAQCKITYTKTNHKVVVKKVKIDPKDTKIWMEKEKNSVFFRNLINKCVLCVSKLQPRESLKQHLATFHNNKSSTHVCPVCKIVLKTTKNLNDHLEQHLFLLRCGSCGYLCYGKHNMKDHVLKHKRSIECLECGAIFGYSTEFDAHYKNHFKCKECGKNMLSKEKLEKHAERHHATHYCNECDKTYSEYGKLQEHKKLKHTIERNEESYCVSCDIQFDNSHLFNRHLLHSVAHAHEREKPIQKSQTVTCPECSRVLASKYRLKEHYMSFHSQEKRPRLPCSTCGKQFASRRHLKTHMKYIHDRVERPRNKVCEYCNRGFKSNRVLIHHIRTHTGEKPYNCSFCDASFAQKIAMQKHMQNRHENESSSILTQPANTAALKSK